MGRWKAAASLLSRISRSPSSHNLQPLNSVHSVLLNPRRTTLFRRLFSAIPSSVSDLDPGLHDFGGYGYDAELPEERETGNIPIKAFFLCTSIDLKSLQAENKNDVLPATSRSSNYIALKYRDFPSEITGLGANTRSCRYMVVCQYGSAVLFNVDDHEVESYLRIVQRHSTGFLQDIKKDDYVVKANPLLVGEMQGGPDYIVLKALDTDGIRIIGSVLGQSIALDYFVSQVDGMVEKFAEINRIMEKSGTFTMDRKKLLQLLGQANSNLADVILKVGLFERSEIAWRDAKYAQIYEYLRDEYEVTQRFGNLNFKLKFVEHNIHFLQDVLQNQRSNLLEWCIIFLLSIENIISLYEIIRESDQAPLILQQAAQEIPADALTNFLCSF